jgi:uncharacterized protein with HEPN domain
MPILDLSQCLPKLEAVFAAQPDVLLTYVFGSQAKGKAHARSELDVAMLLMGELDRVDRTQRRLDVIGDLMTLFHINTNLFAQLGDTGVLPQSLAARMADMAKFRNVPVHLYTDVDLDRVYGYIQGDLGDSEAFANHIVTCLDRANQE